MENCHSFSDISKTTPIVTESTTTTLKSTTVTDKDPDDCFQYNTDFNHQYINLNHGPDHKVDSATECLALCLELDDCEGFTWSGTEMQGNPITYVFCKMVWICNLKIAIRFPLSWSMLAKKGPLWYILCCWSRVSKGR